MKNIIVKHLRINARKYIFLCLILFLSIMIGVVVVNNARNETKEEISIIISDFINSIKNNNSIDYWKILKKSIIKNIKYIVLIIIISFSIWGKVGNIVIISYKGFCIGYSIATALNVLGIRNGLIFSISLLLISQIVLIPLLMYTIVSSMNTYKEIMQFEYDNKKYLVIKNLFSSIIAIFFAICISFFQTFFCSNLFLLFIKHY